MKREALLIGVAAAVLAAVPIARAGGDVSAGHALFEKNCELCHGRNGQGDGPIAEDLKVHPADLTHIAARRGGSFPEAEVGEIIEGRQHLRGHGNEMPIWGSEFAAKTADPAERRAAVRQKLDDLVAYLRSIQATAPAAGSR